MKGIEAFSAVYERFVGNKLPARAALIDAMREAGVPTEYLDEAVDTLSVNLRFVGLLQMLSGAERIVSLDHALERVPGGQATNPIVEPTREGGALITHAKAQLETTCFYIAPIGEDGSEFRRHSDLFLGSLVEPAIEPFSLRVVRADHIDQPGLIGRHIMEYLLHARLVVADLSYHNPNVFYELAVRHAARLPVVQIIRQGDPLPFDVGQMRTVVIDTTDIFSFVPRIQTYVSEISSHVRRALDDPDANENPVSAYHPQFKISTGQ